MTGVFGRSIRFNVLLSVASGSLQEEATAREEVSADDLSFCWEQDLLLYWVRW